MLLSKHSFENIILKTDVIIHIFLLVGTIKNQLEKRIVLKQRAE